MTVIVLVLTLTALALAVLAIHRLRKPGMAILQWGRFTNTRPGIRGHKVWSDEAEVVEYVDYRYWIRLRPNPGFNLPRPLGYWSRSRGRQR